METEEINPIMRPRELAIGVKERRVACHGLVKQLHGLEKILLCPRAKGNAIDQVFRLQVEIVRNEIRGRWLFDSGFRNRRDFGSKLICDLLRDLALDCE